MITIAIPIYAILHSLPTTLMATMFCIGAALIFFVGGKICSGTVADLEMNNPFYIGGLILVALGLVFFGAFIGDSIIASMPSIPPIEFPIWLEFV